MKWTMGITQWSMPGNRDYTLRLAKQLGFDAVQLEFGSWENGMALSHSRLRNLYREESVELGIKLLPLTINALCRYGVVNGLDTPDGKIAKDTILASLEAAADMGNVLDACGMTQLFNDCGMEQLRLLFDSQNYSGTIVLENNYGSLPLCAKAEDRFELAERDMKTVREFMYKR